MRARLVGLGGLQVGLTTAAVMGGALVFGLPWQTPLAVGVVLALSSTAIVLQTLTEKGLMTTPGGRSTFSVLLTQDIAVIPILALIPLLAPGETGASIAADGSIRVEDGPPGSGDHGGLSLVDGLPGWGVTLVTIGAVALVILLGIYATRPVFRYIHQARLREMYSALALLMVVGVAMLMSLVGLSSGAGHVPRRGPAGQLRIPPRTRKRPRTVQGAASGPVLHHRRRRDRFSTLLRR